MRDFEKALDGLTHRTRFTRYLYTRRAVMPLLEIKGLGADIADLKKGISDLRVAAREVNSEKTTLIMEMNDVRDQLRKHRSDLRFEAETLGNSSSTSSNNTEEEKKSISSEEDAVDKLLGNSAETDEQNPPVVSVAG